jgi:ABC-type multidrug transport system, permease component
MRTIAMVKRICRQMLRDKRTLALLVIAPLFIMSLMYFLFNNTKTNYVIGADHIDKSIIQSITKSDIKVKEYQNVTSSIVVKDNLDGLLQMKNEKMILTLKNDDPTTAKVLQMKLNQAITSQIQLKTSAYSKDSSSPALTTKYRYGSKNTTFFDVFSTVLVGFFVFFFVFLISGIGLLRERTTGTLERLISTPIKRSEIVTGYLIGYGIFAIVQTILVVLFSITVLNILIVGSIWYVILINLLLALVALSLGILLSTFAASEFQMLQFIPIIIVPQLFFSGIFPIESMPYWLQILAKSMPFYYGAHALKCVMYKGQGFHEILVDICVLAVFASVFISLNIAALKKYRQL